MELIITLIPTFMAAVAIVGILIIRESDVTPRYRKMGLTGCLVLSTISLIFSLILIIDAL